MPSCHFPGHEADLALRNTLVKMGKDPPRLGAIGWQRKDEEEVGELGSLENVMSPDPSQNIYFSRDLKSESIVLGNPPFPDIGRPLYLFNPQRWMTGIIKKQGELFVRLLFYGFRQVIVVPIKRAGRLNFHLRFRRCPINLSAFSKVFDSSPLAIASSASFSFSCHSLDQNQA